MVTEEALAQACDNCADVYGLITKRLFDMGVYYRDWRVMNNAKLYNRWLDRAARHRGERRFVSRHDVPGR